MGLTREAAVAATIAYTEVVRSVRAIYADRRQLGALVVSVIGFTPFVVFAVPSLFFAGRAVAAGDVALSSVAVRGRFVTTLVGLVGLGAIRGLERSSTVEGTDFLLTAVSPRALALGLFTAEYVRTLAVVGPILVIFYGAFLLGAGTPAAVALAVVAALPALAAGLSVGHLLGVGTRVLTQTSRLPKRTGRSVGVVLGVGLVFVSVLAAPAIVEFVETPPAQLAAVPVAPYADLFFLATPATFETGLETAMAIVLVVAVVPAALAISVPLSRRLWLGDGTERTDGKHGSVDVPSALAESELGGVIFRLWLRGVRSPTRFVHLLYVFFISVPALGTLAGASRPLLWTPPFAVAVGATVAGGTFGLNPLGDEGDALPTVVLSPLPKRTLVRARILAGVGPWLAVTLAVVLVVGSAGPMTPSTMALLAGFAVVLSVYSGGIAVGVGAVVPRFEAVRSFGVETVSPTTWAIFGHGFAVGIVAVAGFAAIAVPGHVLGVESLAVRVLPLVAVCLVGAVPAVAGYRYAVGRLETFAYE